jgi:hypothetical protein
VKDGPWYCIDEIVKHFSRDQDILNADANANDISATTDGAEVNSNKEEMSQRTSQSLLDWIEFTEVFPRNDGGMGHMNFVETRSNLYRVPFAECFASSSRGVYDRTVIDTLMGGISYDHETLPKAVSMPSAHIGVKHIVKNSVRDVNPRQFADGSTVVRPQKRSIQQLVAPSKCTNKKVRKEDESTRLAREAKQAERAEKKRIRKEEQDRKNTLTDAQRREERAAKCRATRMKNKELRTRLAQVDESSLL